MSYIAGGAPCVSGAPSAPISLVSTRTVDRVPLAGGNIREMPGGPAHYIGLALAELRYRYELVTGPLALVDVLVGPDGEDYLIPELPRIPLPSAFAADAVILSPIMQEIDPAAVPGVDGLIVVDLQGFVRVPMVPFREVRRRFDLCSLIERAALVKAAEDEIARLDGPSQKALDGTTLVITRGSAGATVVRNGSDHHIEVERVEVEGSIGAGDTFLACMVTSMLEGYTPEQAAERAARFTGRMLRARALEARRSTKSPAL